MKIALAVNWVVFVPEIYVFVIFGEPLKVERNVGLVFRKEEVFVFQSDVTEILFSDRSFK